MNHDNPLIDAIEEMLLRWSPQEYAAMIVQGSPLSLIHNHSLPDVINEIKKYGLQYQPFDESFLQVITHTLRTNNVLEDREEILFQWIESPAEFIVSTANTITGKINVTK